MQRQPDHGLAALPAPFTSRVPGSKQPRVELHVGQGLLINGCRAASYLINRPSWWQSCRACGGGSSVLGGVALLTLLFIGALAGARQRHVIYTPASIAVVG